MKLILSRKGFDSAAGGVPSPILPDGRLLSLPIPDRASPIRYQDLRTPEGPELAELVTALTGGRVPPHYRAHLDPDLRPESLPRLPGWRPLLGQTGASQGHLRNQGVGPGDLFLFFDLFREVLASGGTWRYHPDRRPRHVLFGWLQVAKVQAVEAWPADTWPWARYHPHFHRPPEAANTLYVAAERLTLPGQAPGALPGAGLLPMLRPELCLTAEETPSVRQWRLPGWFHPAGRASILSFHGSPAAWQRENTTVRLTSASRGQEFVLDVEDYPEAVAWAAELLRQMPSACR